MKVAVIGGGISGLAAAYRLRRAEHEVVVLEAAARAGGKVFSERVDGFLVEHGPNGFLDARLAAVRLARDVGLGGRMVAANEAASRRFLFSNGALRPVPLSPPAFLKTDLLSTKGKLRLLSEPLVPPRKVAGDESVFDFAARRIGPEAAEMLVDPMVAGIYAGDPRRLSLPAAFPRLRTLEEEHGGLVRGMIAGMAQKRGQRGGPGGPGGQLTSFPGGMSELIDGLVAALDPGAVQTGRPVSAISRRSDRGWRVTAAGGDALDVDGVVLACPTADAARLLAAEAPGAVRPLEDVPYAPAAVVALGYRAIDVPRALDGFGFLVPARERRKVLGVLWSSTLFRGRAPGGQVLLRSIVGGARNPELLDLDDEALLATVRRELAITLGGALPAPTFARVVRWPRAIPQYVLGHLDRRAAAEAATASLPGLVLAGNGLYGVSLADCAARAEEVPELLARSCV